MCKWRSYTGHMRLDLEEATKEHQRDRGPQSLTKSGRKLQRPCPVGTSPLHIFAVISELDKCVTETRKHCTWRKPQLLRALTRVASIAYADLEASV